MTKITIIFCSILLLQFTLVAPSLAETSETECFRKKKQFEFISNGEAKYPVILGTQITPRTLDAVEDLKLYVKKISGAELLVLDELPENPPEKAIWIGFHPELKKLFKKTDFNLKTEEILILISKDHLAILGDDGGGLTSNIEIDGMPFANAQRSYGTINAIYTFLQEFLGVRWFLPNDLGEDYIETENISFKSQEYRFTPKFLSRYGILHQFRPGRSKKMRPREIWSARQRLFYSSVIVDIGHPFKDWWDQYSQDFPNIFALTSENKRIPIGLNMNVKFCVSNPELHELWIKDLQKRVQKNPFLYYINVGDNDSYHTGHCLCENCRDLDGMDITQPVKNLSDRTVFFANALKDVLEKTLGKSSKYKVLYTAYGNARFLPIKAKLSPDIGVISVANFHLRRGEKLDSSENSHIRDFMRWSSLASELFWRPNLGSPVGLQWGFFDVPFSQSFENFKFVADRKVKGVFFDMYFSHWATQGIQYYVDAQLAWNPYLNKEELLNDYFTRFYGSASAEMKQFWEEIENKRNALYFKYGDLEARYWVHEVFTEDWFAKQTSMIENEISKLNTSQMKYALRLEFTLDGLKHARIIAKIRNLMHIMETEKNKSLEKDVLELWSYAEAHYQSIHPDAINFNTLKIVGNNDLDNIKRNSRMNGLYPSSPKRIRIRKKEDFE